MADAADRANAAREERVDILHRKNAALITDAEATALRTAFAEIKQISADARGDSRGFFEHAGQHGIPYWTCPHHTPERIFLPWHRAYLYRLEQALQDRVPSVTLPWWDWSTTRQIPPAFAAAEVDGAPNALAGSDTLVTAADIRPGAPVIERTNRDTNAPSLLPEAAQLEAALRQSSFGVFSDACEGLHDSVHGWCGGTMANIGYAAFDPVFWTHHCMVDRLWWLWQQSGHMNAVPAPGWEDIVLEPFNLRVRDVLNANALGFDYADFEALFQADESAGEPGSILVTKSLSSADVVPVSDFTQADLEIGGIRHTGSSYEGLVYLNNPDATPDTGTGADAGYVGSFHVFGHGGCFGAEGHCEAPERRHFDNRPLARSIRMKKRVDVTEPLRDAAGSSDEISFTIVARVTDGLPGLDPQGVLDVKRLSVVTYR